jgi:hypothetical protein
MSSKKARFGRVSSVFLNSDKNEVFVNVITNPNQEPRKLKFSTPQKGFWLVPNEGDIVEVHTIGGTKVARYPSDPPTDFGLPTDLSEGDVCLKLNQDTELHFSIQNDGTVNVEITADGEVTVNAPSVKIGDKDGTFKPVARQGDPISGTGKDGASVTGQIDDGSSSVSSS